MACTTIDSEKKKMLFINLLKLLSWGWGSEL